MNRHRAHRVAPATLAAMALIATTLPLPAAAGPQQEQPAGYVQVAPRGSVPAIDDPVYVNAAEAQIRDEAWVLGVIIDGQARAYSLELLNSHAVVNDSIADTDFAAVWSPIANAAVVYDRNYGGDTLSFEASGGLMNASLVLQDKETDTYWSIMSGRAEAGPLEGTALTELPVGEKMSWAEWHAKHPDTLVLSTTQQTSDGTEATIQDPGSDTYGAYFAGDEGYNGVEATDSRLATKAQIHAFLHEGTPYAIELRRTIGGRTFELSDGSVVFIFREASDEMFRSSAAFISEAGFEQRGGMWFEIGTGAEFNGINRNFGGAAVERLNGFDTFWYTWSLTHTNTELFR